jgi:FAS-associated factor 2
MDAGLDEHQQQALAQLQTLTNGGDKQTAIDILASVDWDVQVYSSVFI